LYHLLGHGWALYERRRRILIIPRFLIILLTHAVWAIFLLTLTKIRPFEILPATLSK